MDRWRLTRGDSDPSGCPVLPTTLQPSCGPVRGGLLSARMADPPRSECSKACGLELCLARIFSRALRCCSSLHVSSVAERPGVRARGSNLCFAEAAGGGSVLHPAASSDSSGAGGSVPAALCRQQRSRCCWIQSMLCLATLWIAKRIQCKHFFPNIQYFSPKTFQSFDGTVRIRPPASFMQAVPLKASKRSLARRHSSRPEVALVDLQ